MSTTTTAALGATLAKKTFDAVIVGAGHNGLVAAAYLAKAGLQVCVVERRDVIGGAAVSEEIVPGFKFSRASYLLSLLRPAIVKDLELKKHGLKLYLRETSSFTPLLDGSNYLMLGRNSELNHAEISKFSKKDADAFPRYEAMLESYAKALDPLLDSTPINIHSSQYFWKYFNNIGPLMKFGLKIRKSIPEFSELLTAPATQILDRWFESKILKATLATDAVIGGWGSPRTPGSAYVLFHHVMGELEGARNVWAYVEGGMGSVSKSIASAALSYGATIITDAESTQIVTEKTRGGKYKATGVALKDGTVIHGKRILSNATPKVTFLDLLESNVLDETFRKSVENIDYSSGVMKINVAVDRLPNFKAKPNVGTSPGPQHLGTIHFEEDVDEIHKAFVEATLGRPSEKPVIEMGIPSAHDPTIAPPGKHVVSLFVQWAPYNLDPKVGSWDDESFKNAYADKVFKIIDEYAPGFSNSVIGRDVLSTVDLERIFNLTGGNIFHGSMNLSQLYFMRPNMFMPSYKSPVSELYLCGSGAHPGGGVMGAAGRNCALTVLKDLGEKNPFAE